MPVSRTKFNPSLPFVVAREFLFQSVRFKVGKSFPDKDVVCGVRQLRGLYSNRLLEVEKGKEVDTPATKRAKRKSSKKTKKIKKVEIKEPSSDLPWNNSDQ